jgi:hypothetical protein
MRFRDATVALVVVLTAPALAQPKPRAILLESYAGGRPREVGPIVEKVREGADVLSGEKLRAAIENEVARPVSVASPQAMERLTNRAAEGAAAFEAAEFVPATAALAQASDGLGRESPSLILDPKLREARKAALTTMALAYARMRRFDAARETLQELVRSHPDVRAFPDSVFPPKIAELGAQVLKEKAQHGGTLSVTTIPTGRKLYLDEEPVGESPRILNGLLPGRYRLFIPSAKSEQSGTVRLVDVEPARRRSLLATLDVDEHLELNEYLGLAFADDEDKQRLETPLACALGQELGASEVVILTQGYSPSGDSQLLAAVYSVGNGNRSWAVTLPLSPPPGDNAIAALVQSLRTRKEVPPVRPFEGRALESRPPKPAPTAARAAAPPPPPPPPSSEAPRADGKWLALHSLGWVALVAGIPTFLAGVGLASRSGLGTCGSTTQLCPSTYSDQSGGTVLLALGAAAMVAAPAWLALHDDYYRQLRSYGIAALLQGATAMASGGLLLYYNQMPKGFASGADGSVVKITPGYEPWAQAAFAVGAITGATGIALLVADRFFHRRESRSWDKPMVSLTATGIAGKF